MRVCQVMVVRPRCSGVHSPVTVVPTGAEPKKLVFDSMVTVRSGGGALITVATAPSVSAKAMMAPP